MSVEYPDDPSRPEYWGLNGRDVKVYAGGSHDVSMEGPNIRPYVIVVHLPTGLYAMSSSVRKGQLSQKIETLEALSTLMRMHDSGNYNLSQLRKDVAAAMLSDYDWVELALEDTDA